jgi:hypothetical protein
MKIRVKLKNGNLYYSDYDQFDITDLLAVIDHVNNGNYIHDSLGQLHCRRSG